MDPSGRRLLLTTSQTYPSIERVARPFYKLAGVRLEPANRSRHDTPAGYGIPACVADFTLVDIASGRETRVALPAGACPSPACGSATTWRGSGSRGFCPRPQRRWCSSR